MRLRSFLALAVLVLLAGAGDRLGGEPEDVARHDRQPDRPACRVARPAAVRAARRGALEPGGHVELGRTGERDDPLHRRRRHPTVRPRRADRAAGLPERGNRALGDVPRVSGPPSDPDLPGRLALVRGDLERQVQPSQPRDDARADEQQLHRPRLPAAARRRRRLLHVRVRRGDRAQQRDVSSSTRTSRSFSSSAIPRPASSRAIRAFAAAGRSFLRPTAGTTRSRESR